MKLLTDQQQELYENAKTCYICKEKFENKNTEDKKCCKVRDHCHYTGEYRDAAHILFNLKYSVPKKIPIFFHIGANYDYHFIIKELAEKFNCLGKSTKKYITFSVPIEVKRIDKNGEEITKTISYRLKFIDSAKSMATSLIHKIKCTNCNKCCIECTNFKDGFNRIQMFTLHQKLPKNV